jgi:preprotein translocase subunit SecF
MKSAKAWITMSIVLTLLGVGAIFARGFNKGIDFTGGLFYDIRFDQAITSAQITDAAKKSLNAEVVVQKAEVKGTANGTAIEYFLRTPELKEDQQLKLKADLKQLGNYTIISEDQVSGSVSTELRDQAILAILIAAVLQILYLSVRFQFKFGVTAVVALLHDVIITAGAVALFGIQINSPFVAAILTILGYSINDTVIVFDRIRENLARRKKGEDLEALTTRSMQEVITRSIYTVLTVLFTLACMLVWGGDSIWDFALTLFIGITSGMYSSIFIAAALWLYWQKWEDANRRAAAIKKIKPAKA